MGGEAAAYSICSSLLQALTPSNLLTPGDVGRTLPLTDRLTKKMTPGDTQVDFCEARTIHVAIVGYTISS